MVEGGTIDCIESYKNRFSDDVIMTFVSFSFFAKGQNSNSVQREATMIKGNNTAQTDSSKSNLVLFAFVILVNFHFDQGKSQSFWLVERWISDWKVARQSQD